MNHLALQVVVKRQFFTFILGTNYISEMAEAKMVKFCTHVGYIKSQHMDDRSPLKGSWSRSRDQFSVTMPTIISPEESPNFVCR